MPYQDFTGTVAPATTPVANTVVCSQTKDTYKNRYVCTYKRGSSPVVGTALTIVGTSYTAFPSGTITISAIELDSTGNPIFVLDKIIRDVANSYAYVNSTTKEITFSFTSVNLYSELTSTNFNTLPAGTYSIGKYYSPFTRYRDITSTIYYKTNSGASGTVAVNLNLYSATSNFTTSQDLTGQYIGNCLNTLEVRSAATAIAAPSIISPSTTTNKLYNVLLDSGLEQQTSATVPFNNETAKSKSTAYYTTTLVSNSTNTINRPESTPAAYSTSVNTVTIAPNFLARFSSTNNSTTITFISGTLPAVSTQISVPGLSILLNKKFTVQAVSTTTGIITISPAYSTVAGNFAVYIDEAQDAVVKLYSDIPQDLDRIRSEHRIALVSTELDPRANATLNTLVIPKTSDDSLIIPPAKSDRTNSYLNNSFIIARSNLWHQVSATSTDISECPPLIFAGYNTNTGNSLDFTNTTISDTKAGIVMTSGAPTFALTISTTSLQTDSTDSAIKITIGAGTEIWYSGQKIANIFSIAYNSPTGKQTITMDAAWPGTYGNGTFTLTFRKTYKRYTLDPETGKNYAAFSSGSRIGSAYSTWIQNESRWLSSGFYTVSPYYTVKRQDGTLIGNFSSTDLFETITASGTTGDPKQASDYLYNFTSATDMYGAYSQAFSNIKSTTVWRDYYPKVTTTNTTTTWFTPQTISTTLKLAKTTRTKLMELYYTYGPCFIEVPVQILQRVITAASRTGLTATLDYTPTTYSEITYTDIVRFNLKETIVPISTPTIDLIRPSALLAFSSAPSTYKFSVSAARLTSNYSYEKKYAISSINTSSNLLTIPNHGLNTGDFVRFSSASSVPTGLGNNKYYYVAVFDTNNVYLCKSYKNAFAYYDYVASIDVPITPVNITSKGGRKEQYLVKDTAEYTKVFSTSANFNTKDGKVVDTSDTIEFSSPHSFVTGDKVLFTYFGVDKHYITGFNGGPSFSSTAEALTYMANIGLTDGTYYYIIKIDDYKVSIAETYSSALAIIKLPLNQSYGQEFRTARSDLTVSNTKPGTYGRINKLPIVISEITDKSSGYIGFGTDVNSRINAAPGRTLTGADLSGKTSLDISLYSINRANGGALNKVTIPVVGTTSTPTSMNSAQFYALSEVAFLPSIIIRHIGSPLDANKDFIPYSTLDTKVNNIASFSASTNKDFVISAANITGSGAASNIKNSLYISTGHNLTNKSPVRVSTSNQTAITAANYNAITKIKLSSLISGDIGSLLGTTLPHNYSTGDVVMYQKGKATSSIYDELLDVLLSGRKYYVIVIDAYWFKIATSPETAKDNKGIVFNTFGSFSKVPVNGVDTTTATIYFKYAQTKALLPAEYTSSSSNNNPVKAIWNQQEFSKTTFTFKPVVGDDYAQQIYTTSAQTTLATSVVDNIVIGYFDNLSTFPKNINCYDTYYAQIIDTTRFRLTRNYGDTNYVPIEPPVTGTSNVNVYVGVAPPTSTALIVDSQTFGTENPLALSLGWTYSLGTANTSSDNIDGFIVYVSNTDTVGSDSTKDYMYTVPYDDQYADNKYGIVLYNLPSDYFYVAVAAYRYRNNYDYRHQVFFSSDSREFQRSTLLKASIPTLPASATTTTLKLADGTYYTTTKKYFIPNANFNYDLSQGYSDAISKLYIDGKAGTLKITRGTEPNTITQTPSQFTSEGKAYDYIPYISTDGTYKYISSKDNIVYTNNIVLPYRPAVINYGSSSNKK